MCLSMQKLLNPAPFVLKLDIPKSCTGLEPQLLSCFCGLTTCYSEQDGTFWLTLAGSPEWLAERLAKMQGHVQASLRSLAHPEPGCSDSCGMRDVVPS